MKQSFWQGSSMLNTYFTFELCAKGRKNEGVKANDDDGFIDMN